MADKPNPKQVQASGRSQAETAQAHTAGLHAELAERHGFDVWLHQAVRQAPSWLVSMVVHMIVLLVMALIALPGPREDGRGLLNLAQPDDQTLDALDPLADEPLEKPVLTADPSPPDVSREIEPELAGEDGPVDVAMAPAPEAFALSDFPDSDLLARIGPPEGDRHWQRNHSPLAVIRGATDESKWAVDTAHKWLARHQCADGGWSFDLTRCPACRGQCRHSGKEVEARIAATGLAVMTFLGAGQTHKQGEYTTTVNRGLYFLLNHMKLTPQGGSLYEKGGRMYSHGIASIALCEAYAMTGDRSLYAPAQAAINYICYAQDPVGGGWRYEPRQPGDTSVVGWQLMALKSAHLAYLQVPQATTANASRFFDSVQTNSGANYGYTGPGNGPATTAIGLLSRMYLGWKKDNPALQRGVAWLSRQGPSGPRENGKANMYYNYYATQVMLHWEGAEWKKWNEVMRDFLVETQATKGHEAGSWYFGGQWSDRGGRLYDTALAAMTLEVYYRCQPIYRAQSVEVDFPVE